MDTLPVEIIALIALNDIESYRNCLSLPVFARYTLNLPKEILKEYRSSFIVIKITNLCKKYYLNGKLHREDGPAVEYTNRYKFYYLNGELHRENGPAIEYANGDKEYWINGNKIN